MLPINAPSDSIAASFSRLSPRYSMKTLEGAEPEHAWSAHIYKDRRTGGKSIRTGPLDCKDGAVRRVAPVKGPDPNLRNESCRQVFPSQVRDACGQHAGIESTRRAIASDQSGAGHGLCVGAAVLANNLMRIARQGLDSTPIASSKD